MIFTHEEIRVYLIKLITYNSDNYYDWMDETLKEMIEKLEKKKENK